MIVLHFTPERQVIDYESNEDDLFLQLPVCISLQIFMIIIIISYCTMISGPSSIAGLSNAFSECLALSRISYTVVINSMNYIKGRVQRKLRWV